MQSIYKEDVLKVFASLGVESVKIDSRVSMPRDMALTFFKSEYLLGGLDPTGEDSVKERNYNPLGANYARIVQHIVETVDFRPAKIFKISFVLRLAEGEELEKLSVALEFDFAGGN